MKPQTKLALRRFALRWIRKAFDAIEDRLHSAEVRLREDLSPIGVSQVASQHVPASVRSVRTTPVAPPRGETFDEWEMRKSGVAPVSKKAARARRQRMSARDFDLRYAR